MRVITRLSLAAALTASLALGACASRKPLPTSLPQAGDPGAGLGAGTGGPTVPGPAITGGPMPPSGTPVGPTSGLPGAPAPGSMQAFVIEAGDRVFFDTDSHGLHDQAINTLTAQSAWLNRHPAVRVIVEATPTNAARASTTSRSAPAAPTPCAISWSVRA
jgi:outer membrane protein OmpA-like peptidoglycan-associated protein